MYTILLPIGDEESLADAQAEFVTAYPTGDKSEVEVVATHVLRGVELDAPEAMRKPGRVGTVRRAVEKLEDSGFSVSVKEAGSPPAEGIIELAKEIDADHIVMGGHKRSPAGKAIFGSVTQSVILDTDVPVTVTGGSED
ncbi:universal stress protein [Halorientalis salina]|uniref:universal stress protein n=1 Tax=Halorientalis salina TaxID=2932266 RepID=UPI0010AC9A08|nr:universal stress protein [Halorientalis salina]